MPYRADLELARRHLEQIESLIVSQQARIEELRWEGVSDASAVGMLEFLTRSRGYLIEYIEKTAKANE